MVSIFKLTYLAKLLISTIFFGFFDLNLVNFGILQIFSKILDISINLIFPLRKRFTNLSFALTITVSNNESSWLRILRILIAGNLVLSIFFRFRLFKDSKLIFLDLSLLFVLK